MKRSGLGSTPRASIMQREVLASPFWAWPGYLLFFLMLFGPTVFKPVKIGLVVLVLVIIGAMVLRRNGRLGVARPVTWWTGLLTTVGLFFIIRGVVRGHPGAIPELTVFVMWPWLYLAFISAASRDWVVRDLFRVMIVALIAIEIYTVLFFLHRVGLWPSSLFIEMKVDQAITLQNGIVAYSLPSIDTLVYLVPFVVGALMAWPRRNTGDFDAPVGRKWLWVALIGGLGLMMASGRLALQLVVILSPAFALLYRSMLPSRKQKMSGRSIVISFAGMGVGALVVFLYLEATYGISFEAMIQAFQSGFDWRGDESAYIRVTQFVGLIEAWAKEPVLGTGFGADVGATRVAFDPWSYELEYFALLAHTGIVGAGFYAAGTAWIFVRAIRLVRQGSIRSAHMVPVLVGTSCFLIASGVNQYLLKYDFMWTIFLPIALINIDLLRARAQSQ